MTILGVTDDIERFHFNKAVARIRELTNALEALKDAPKTRRRLGLSRRAGVAVRLIGTMTPHLAEELW